MSAPHLDLSALKYGALACLFLALLLLALAVAGAPGLARPYVRYTADLERRMRMQFIEVRGGSVALGQVALALLAVLAYLLSGVSVLLVLVPIAAVLPRFWLERRARRRTLQIEQRLDGFVLSLANALRATPSIGAALASVTPLAPAPLDEELELVLREMRVGSTLEQALLGLGNRIDSLQLDAVLNGLLIGRKVGGNVPEILENIAGSLREMARLSGVLRSRTAEGRVQTTVLAVFPLVLVFAFDMSSAGYFDPLVETGTGVMILSIAATLWVASVLIARRIMAVSL